MGLLRGVARTAVVAGTATTVANRVSRRQSKKWAAQDQQQEQQADAQEPAVSDTTAQLQELASLKGQGILTQDEFDAKKKQILGI